MAFEIKTPPEFTVEIEQWNRETLADGIEMSKVIEKLLNNTIYNKHQRECHILAPPSKKSHPYHKSEEYLRPFLYA